jgi:preprotein translocase subunit SecF
VVRSFTAAMIWGVFVATASSIFIGGPILIYFNLRPGQKSGDAEEADAKTAKVS